jgi:hypothetical protein
MHLVVADGPRAVLFVVLQRELARVVPPRPHLVVINILLSNAHEVIAHLAHNCNVAHWLLVSPLPYQKVMHCWAAGRLPVAVHVQSNAGVVRQPLHVSAGPDVAGAGHVEEVAVELCNPPSARVLNALFEERVKV